MNSHSKVDILALKQRLLKNQDRPCTTGASASSTGTLTFVTRLTKISKPLEKNADQTKRNDEDSGIIYYQLNLFTSNFLKMVLQYISQAVCIAHRPMFTDSHEQIEITRIKPDITDLEVPITAARILIRDDGLCQFSLITGFTEKQTVDINSCTEENIASIIPFLEKLSETYVFCEGLPYTLPEIRYYESPFQVLHDYPYKHVRSKHCYLWYEQTKGVSIRERMGIKKPRCSPCKKYLCVISKWCRTKLGKDVPPPPSVINSKNNSKFQLKRDKYNLSSKKSKCQSKQNKINKNLQSCTEDSVEQCITPFIGETSSYLCNDMTMNTEEVKACLLALYASDVSALYDSSDDVIELTASNFNNRVLNGDEVWLVEFYAPWCGHCRSLAPEWKKAATALKGIVNVGAVDMDQHQSVGGPYNVRGFPTIKIFAGNKQSPQDYNGARSAQSLVDEALKTAKRVVSDRLSGRGGGGSRSSGGGGGSGNSDDVVTLTDANFEKEVLNSKDVVLVEFYAPWCGHCQRLAPEWAKAATELKGKVKVCALDATVHTVTGSRFQVQGYPTIKYFPAGSKDYSSAEDYQGGRTASDIIAFALNLHAEAVEPPEIFELISNKILTDNCNEKPLCVVSFLPDILDTQAAGRQNYLSILRELGEKYKKKLWGWVWTAAGVHPNLEQALGVGGFGYPAMAVVNVRKKVYVLLRGSFGRDGIDELLKSIAVGRGRTEKLNDLPQLSDVPAWDGKDGELPAEEEIDLSDVVLDDLDNGENKVEL